MSYCNVQSRGGHDAFLLEDELAVYGEMTRGFLANLGATSDSAVAVQDGPQGPTSIFQQHRLDYDRIVELIPPGASVLDLGCGPGTLLSRLKRENHRRLVGVELDQLNILTCVSRGLDVVQTDLNEGLGAFGDREFDCVVLSQTLQAVYDVEKVITDMVRIGKSCVVSIPNFGYEPLRRMLAETGRAPKSSGVLRHEWYNTPNIRFFTIADFEDFCREKKITVHRQIALDTEAGAEVAEDANLKADLAIFVISKET